MLEFNSHSSSVTLKVTGVVDEKFSVIWSHKIDQTVKRSWGDRQEAAEYGAAGIALLLLIKLTGWSVVERAFIGTHVDYYLGIPDKTEQIGFKRLARVEVSGIGKETKNNRLSKRLKEKLEQVRKSIHSNLPAYVVAVEFGTPKAKTAKE